MLIHCLPPGHSGVITLHQSCQLQQLRHHVLFHTWDLFSNTSFSFSSLSYISMGPHCLSLSISVYDNSPINTETPTWNMVPVVLTALHWLHISVGIILLVVSVILTDPTEKLSSLFCLSHSCSCVHCRFYPFLHCLGVDLRLNLSLPLALFSLLFSLSVFSVFRSDTEDRGWKYIVIYNPQFGWLGTGTGTVAFICFGWVDIDILTMQHSINAIHTPYQYQALSGKSSSHE
jgi:hypothetical protein